jgi:hypothetical protein
MGEPMVRIFQMSWATRHRPTSRVFQYSWMNRRRFRNVSLVRSHPETPWKNMCFSLTPDDKLRRSLSPEPTRPGNHFLRNPLAPEIIFSGTHLLRSTSSACAIRRKYQLRSMLAPENMRTSFKHSRALVEWSSTSVRHDTQVLWSTHAPE